MRTPCGRKYTLGRGSDAPGLSSLPAQSRMDSYTITTLKEDPHAACLQGCIVVKLSPRFGPFRGGERRRQVPRFEAGVLRTKMSITFPI